MVGHFTCATDKRGIMRTIALHHALEKLNLPGHTDVWSGLGQVYLTSVDAWYKADANLTLRVGGKYIWKNREGEEFPFTAPEA